MSTDGELESELRRELSNLPRGQHASAAAGDDSLEDELRRELSNLKVREQRAIVAGKEAVADALRTQIVAIEAKLAALGVRVSEVERKIKGGYRFEIRRGSDSLMTEVIATPLT